MKTIILGSGVIGVTTVYFLRRCGHEVTVIDRQQDVGRETSFANGALLTPSMSEPWNAPGSWRVLLASLVRTDSPLQLRWRSLPTLLSWGAGFLRNSTTSNFECNTLSNVRLSLYSLEVMRTLRQASIEYGRTALGSLKFFRDSCALERTLDLARRLSPEGLGFRRLSRDEIIALEPGLAPIASDLAGAIHYQVDETGDSYRFSVALADLARNQGVDFRFRIPVASIEVRSGRVTAVVTPEERFEADRYIVAAGSYSTPLLGRIGIALPVQPAKGYSVTFPFPADQQPLRIPLIDDDLHAAIVPLEGAIRVAGTAEFAGYDRADNPARIRNLVKLLQDVLPWAHLDHDMARPWCGLRAMSADGVPIIGPTSISNLLVNTGHGHLGWTMAAGSAQLLTDLISGDGPAIDPAPFALSRFAAAR